MNRFMKHRKTHPVEIAAVKASLSQATVNLLCKQAQLLA